MSVVAVVGSGFACDCTSTPEIKGRTPTTTYPDGGHLVDAGHPVDAGPHAVTLESIAVTPLAVTLTISGSTPATQTFTATGTYTDGHTADVTSQATFEVGNPTLGNVNGGRFTSVVTQGGATALTASVGPIEGSAAITLVLKQKLNDPASSDLGPNPASLFTGSDGGAPPQLVYPNDGVLLPPNLNQLEIHFLPGAGNTVFQLAFENAITDVKVYLNCTAPMNNGCIYLPDAMVWTYLAQTNKGGAPLAVTLSGTDATGTQVGTSKPIQISFSHDALNGGLYYWTTSNSTGIMRFDFASTTQTTAELFAGPSLTGGTCLGCHALSHDGTRLVAETGGQNDGRLLLLDVATQTPIVPFPADGQYQSIFESWGPDAGQFVGVYGDTQATDFNLLLFSGSTGLPSSPADIPGTGTAQNPVDHPDWAPDGTKIAFVKVGTPGTMQRMFGGAIEMVTAADAGEWGGPSELVPSATGKNRYYPAWAPDSAFLVYDESTCASPGSPDTSCDADTDMSATLFAVEGRLGSTPMELTRANTPGVMDGTTTQLTDSFPKWSPFVFQRTSELGSRLMWITFSSTRQFGLRSPPAGGTENPSGTFLWMAAIDPDQLANGVDPSYPAFCLPFQDITTSNHIAQWTTKVVGSVTPPIPR